VDNCGTHRACGVIPSDGVCGSAAKQWEASDTGWSSSTLCTQHYVMNPQPSFPSQGGSVTWKCAGNTCGQNMDCTATRKSPTCTPGSCSVTTPQYSMGGGSCSTGSTVIDWSGGTGPWTWKCKGPGCTDDQSTSCSVAKKVNGVCSPDYNGKNVRVKPGTSNVCSFGHTDAVTTNGANPNRWYTWTCSGENEGSSADCTAYQVLNGECGSTAPDSTASCNAGDLSPKIKYTTDEYTGDYKRVWTCKGYHSGESPICTSVLTMTGNCGNFMDQQVHNYEELGPFPTSQTNWCLIGHMVDYRTYYSETGGKCLQGYWYWTCTGSNGGANSIQCFVHHCG
jgi:hypothetical protein